MLALSIIYNQSNYLLLAIIPKTNLRRYLYEVYAPYTTNYEANVAYHCR